MKKMANILFKSFLVLAIALIILGSTTALVWWAFIAYLNPSVYMEKYMTLITAMGLVAGLFSVIIKAFFVAIRVFGKESDILALVEGVLSELPKKEYEELK